MKSAFRRKSLETHPDRNKEMSGEDFIAVKQAYEILAVSDMTLKMTGEEKEALTVDGIALNKLGKGLSISKAGVKCEACSGKGYTEEPVGNYIWQTCPYCQGKFKLTELPCRKCSGSGKFKKNGKVVGKCFQCQGTGKFYPKHPVTCRECNPFNEEGEFGRILAELDIHDLFTYRVIMHEWRKRTYGFLDFLPSRKGMFPDLILCIMSVISAKGPAKSNFSIQY